MSIVIRKDTERHKLPLSDGAGIVYRRLSGRQNLQFQSRATDNRGNTDWPKVVENVLRAGVVDWYGFVDEHGNPITFDINLFLDMPSELHNKVAEVLNKMETPDATDNGAAPRKNLESS